MVKARSPQLTLLDNDAVGPLHEAYKNRGISKLRTPIAEVAFRDATRPAAGPSSKNGNVLGGNFFKRFRKCRPSHRKHGASGGLAH
jgi:hypothetical protein